MLIIDTIVNIASIIIVNYEIFVLLNVVFFNLIVNIISVLLKKKELG